MDSFNSPNTEIWLRYNAQCTWSKQMHSSMKDNSSSDTIANREPNIGHRKLQPRETWGQLKNILLNKNNQQFAFDFYYYFLYFQIAHTEKKTICMHLPVHAFNTRAVPQNQTSKRNMISKGHLNNKATRMHCPAYDAMSARVAKNWTTINHPMIMTVHY